MKNWNRKTKTIGDTKVSRDNSPYKVRRRREKSKVKKHPGYTTIPRSWTWIFENNSYKKNGDKF